MGRTNGLPEDNTEGACCWETPFESEVVHQWRNGRVWFIAPTSNVGALSGAGGSDPSFSSYICITK